MTSAAQTYTLLGCTVLMSGFGCIVWIGMGAVARLAPKAAYAMAAANAATALCLVLHALRGVLPDALTHWPADVLAIAAFALLRLAVPAIMTRQLAWRSSAAVVVAGAVLLTLLPDTADLRWQTRFICTVAAGLTLAAGRDAWHHLRDAAAASHRTPAPLALPLFLIAALMLLRGVQTVLNPERAANLLAPTEFNRDFLWGALLLCVLQNATLAFLVLMRLVRRIERLIERDPLTDVLNRRAFSQAMRAAHAALKRGRGYALVMIDMDRFKRLNDELGHAAGDAALRQMVGTLQPCLREVDRLGRLGGEEFCVLLPDTDIAGAALVAERMRALLDATPLHWQGRDWPLSASFGIAEAEGADTSSEAVLARADAALYRAKGQGRNVVQA
jgi:diguanylate cyclase (GGDEF)-like protein